MEKSKEEIKKIADIIDSHLGERIYIEFLNGGTEPKFYEGIVSVQDHSNGYCQLWVVGNNGLVKAGGIPISQIYYIAEQKSLDGVAIDNAVLGMGYRYIGFLYKDDGVYSIVHPKEELKRRGL